LIVLVGQVGCITLAVIILSIIAGLWLDATLGTKPIFTLALLFAGVPLSVILMLSIARRTLAKMQAKNVIQETEVP
jgi:F0F1-type ATP synthase assembly protein I